MSDQPRNDQQISDQSINDHLNPAPDAESVVEFLLYGLSIPERAIRSTSAAVSGAVKESANYLVPSAFRDSKSYQVFVQQMLDFMAHDVGGVEKSGENGDGAPEEAQVENFVARKAVGGFIELSTFPLLHVSPLTILAIVSDVAYGSQTFLKELSSELKEQGVIPEDSTIDQASDLLEVIRETTNQAADALDTPPLSVDGLARTIQEITEQARKADLTKTLPQAELERMWLEIQHVATEEEKSILEVSNAMTMYAMNRVGSLGTGALSTITVAGSMFEKNIVDHYWQALDEINERGFYTVLSECSRPYIDAMWQNFSSDRETITQDVLSGRLISRTWTSVSTWLCEWEKPGKQLEAGKAGDLTAGDMTARESENEPDELN